MGVPMVEDWAVIGLVRWTVVMNHTIFISDEAAPVLNLFRYIMVFALDLLSINYKISNVSNILKIKLTHTTNICGMGVVLKKVF